MADANVNEINEAADNGTFLQAAFEVIVSNSKNNDTQNVTGIAVDGNGDPIQAISGNLYVQSTLTPNEGYVAAELKNTNTVYMTAAATGAVEGRPGDHTGIYAHNTYGVNKLTDGDLLVNFPGKTLGLITHKGERSDYTELIVGEKYKFAISNFYEAATYEVGDTFTVKNGVWKETASASITAGDVYAVLTKISSFTEGGLYAGDGYILEIKRKAVADTVGSVVVANPTLAGTEPDLTGLEVDGNKYKLPASALVVTYTITGQPSGGVYPMSTDTAFTDIANAIISGREVKATFDGGTDVVILPAVSKGTDYVAFSNVTFWSNNWSVFQISHTSNEQASGKIVPLSTAQMTFDSTTNTLAIT